MVRQEPSRLGVENPLLLQPGLLFSFFLLLLLLLPLRTRRTRSLDALILHPLRDGAVAALAPAGREDGGAVEDSAALELLDGVLDQVALVDDAQAEGAHQAHGAQQHRQEDKVAEHVHLAARLVPKQPAAHLTQPHAAQPEGRDRQRERQALEPAAPKVLGARRDGRHVQAAGADADGRERDHHGGIPPGAFPIPIRITTSPQPGPPGPPDADAPTAGSIPGRGAAVAGREAGGGEQGERGGAGAVAQVAEQGHGGVHGDGGGRGEAVDGELREAQARLQRGGVEREARDGARAERRRERRREGERPGDGAAAGAG